MGRDQYSRDYVTAVHEAGHAIIRRHFGLCGTDASIEPTADKLGWCEVAPTWCGPLPGPGRRTTWIYRYVVALAAGDEAEKAVFGGSSGGDGIDRENIFEAMKHARIKGCSHVGDDVWWEWENKARREAARLCRRLLPVILALADELVRSRRVSLAA